MEQLNVTAKAAIATAETLLGWHYIYGYKYKYNPVTKSRIKSLAKQNSQVFTDSYYDKACNFIGGYAIDCSGLVCCALNISDIGSYEIRERFPVASEVKPGDVLWRQGHVGLVIQVSEKNEYVKAIEAYTINQPVGIRTYNIALSEWTNVLRPNYKPEPITEVMPQPEIRPRGWVKEKDGRWWYSTGNDNGDYYCNGLYWVEDKQYYFDKEGYCCLPKFKWNTSSGEIIDVVYEYLIG